ncbi:MAG: laccase domain-containing protein, partial [Acidimicrobiia bacterium]|nr:laccase domain-containing protein [Acidimicrobiia bacterium]
ETLLDHPAVAEAIAFAVPHPTLGEDVAAAVVLQRDDGGRTGPGELRRFAGRHLASHKLPRRLVIVEAIPRGPTGKLQRRGLADALGLTGTRVTTRVARRSPLEAALGGLWAETLELERVEPDDDFFVLGGDSLAALELTAQVRELFGVELPAELLAEEATTLAGMARLVASEQARPAHRAGGATPHAVDRRRRAPLRPPDAPFAPSLAERWHGDLRLIVDEDAAALGILLAFSDRSGGVSLAPYDAANLSLQGGDRPDAVLENRRRVAAAAGFDLAALSISRPVFGAELLEVGRRQRGVVGAGDGLVARSSGPVLGLLYADCTPLVLAGRGGVVLVHAARVGVLRGVVERAAAAVGPVWAVWIGPSVRGCCDTVEPGVTDDFEARGLPVVDRTHVDVPHAVTSALRGVGVERVAVWPDCTSCDDRYFSRRRTSTTGRQGAFVAIRRDATRAEHLRSLAAAGRAAVSHRVLRRAGRSGR